MEEARQSMSRGKPAKSDSKSNHARGRSMLEEHLCRKRGDGEMINDYIDDGGAKMRRLLPEGGRRGRLGGRQCYGRVDALVCSGTGTRVS